MTFLRAASVSAFFAMSLAAACSNGADRPAPSGGQGVSPPSPVTGGGGSSGSSGSSGAVDSGAVDSGPPPANLCEGATQKGDVVGELRIVGAQPPALGGAIAAGTYVLASAEAYGASPALDGGDGGEQSGGGPTGIRARGTLVVTATTLRFFGARGPAASLGADAATGFSYTVSGNALLTTAFCPTAGATKTIPFSSVNGALVLFPDAKHREVYGTR